MKNKSHPGRAHTMASATAVKSLGAEWRPKGSALSIPSHSSELPADDGLEGAQVLICRHFLSQPL